MIFKSGKELDLKPFFEVFNFFEKSVALPVFECYNSEAFAWTWEVAGTLIGVVTIAPAKREDRGIHTERICRKGG